MPTIERDGATIYYEVTGRGFPLLLLAPGGLNSAIPFWHRMPLNPIAAFSDEFQVIAMDQRNAGQSRGPLVDRDGWEMYASDQLAVLDALGIERALVAGCCIGGSFILQLVEQAPTRIVAGVLMQPIGLDETNPGAFGEATWTPWGENLIANGHPLTMEQVAAFGHSLFDPGFVFSVSREFLPGIATPLLLLDGNDRAHPKGISEEIARLAPGIERVERWREPEVVAEATETMRQFLRAHTPGGR
ncbi:MAG: alpha/beta fold hydrolase [Chloroflexi bacterium]|nr:alpha/beta fold hydrolase [Chloroflexota bacterium]